MSQSEFEAALQRYRIAWDQHAVYAFTGADVPEHWQEMADSQEAVLALYAAAIERAEKAEAMTGQRKINPNDFTASRILAIERDTLRAEVAALKAERDNLRAVCEQAQRFLATTIKRGYSNDGAVLEKALRAALAGSKP